MGYIRKARTGGHVLIMEASPSAAGCSSRPPILIWRDLTDYVQREIFGSLRHGIFLWAIGQPEGEVGSLANATWLVQAGCLFISLRMCLGGRCKCCPGLAVVLVSVCSCEGDTMPFWWGGISLGFQWKGSTTQVPNLLHTKCRAKTIFLNPDRQSLPQACLPTGNSPIPRNPWLRPPGLAESPRKPHPRRDIQETATGAQSPICGGRRRQAEPGRGRNPSKGSPSCDASFKPLLLPSSHCRAPCTAHYCSRLAAELLAWFCRAAKAGGARQAGP